MKFNNTVELLIVRFKNSVKNTAEKAEWNESRGKNKQPQRGTAEIGNQDHIIQKGKSGRPGEKERKNVKAGVCNLYIL